MICTLPLLNHICLQLSPAAGASRILFWGWYNGEGRHCVEYDLSGFPQGAGGWNPVPQLLLTICALVLMNCGAYPSVEIHWFLTGTL